MEKSDKLYAVHFFFFLFLLLYPSLGSAKHSIASVGVTHLRCEYRENPQGLDEGSPRFQWFLTPSDTTAYGQAQTAYRILVSATLQGAEKKQGDMWDSGWIDSDQTHQIVYKGKELASDRTYYWRVRVRDESGQESAWSEIARWSTGLFHASDWTARWIGSENRFEPTQSADCTIADPWLRKTVTLKKKPVKATLFVASIGYHELYVNGEKIGEDVLAPVVSDHTTRARYIAYDIADKLKPGKNVIAFWLGTSWSIFPPYATEDKPQTPIVLAQADFYDRPSDLVNFTPSLRLVTDATWKTHPSPNQLLGKWESNNYGGEIWDANKEVPDWNSVAYEDQSWKEATVYSPRLALSAQNAEGSRLGEEITPVSIEERPDGSYRVDMGVNFAGWTSIKVKGNPKDRIDFLFSEREQEEMTFRNHSAYILGPTGEGYFRNRFNYSSGRWITIKGLKEKPRLSDIKGWSVRSGVESAATFECSDSLQNWIYDRVRWTFENLSIGGYIVDCPQRERLGYGGDAHATSETGMLNYRMGAFYTKWMQDWRDVQGWESMGGKKVGGGILPHTAPTHIGGGGPSWGGICIVLPWSIYQQEGDTRILERNFELIDQWLQFLNSHTQDGILKRWGGQWDYLGDWLWPNATAEGMNNDKPETECFNSCYYVYNLRLASRIASVLGKAEKARDWKEKADECSKAIHEKYYNPADFSYADRSMGNLAVALLAEVVPTGLREKVMSRLEKEILIIRSGHIHVGITGGAMLFKLLRNENRPDLIYSMVSQVDYPGWGYMKANGATTIWEMWEKDLPGHSLLHSSFLYPGAWYIDGVGGIQKDIDEPGFKQFVIRPPLLEETGIKWAKTSFVSPAGLIKTEWRKENGGVTLKVTVPPNSHAVVYFPTEENRFFLNNSKAAKKKGIEGKYTLYELQAGTFLFRNE
ncbi:family 78 glycoside hydrolase catalytic domain [Parabacteroides sp. Marseille-P3160]|uniref:family 78 glycoside hydrolase catalytic domain n=1 Tax=Parabacteroides sp. Marseille-P3160 TaxID=1917887 RepID=UPI0009BA8FCA|nr:family 78 glycoside hydrolase catalytic domain [Parabacteroides sp. Marseille-P3160]